MITFDLICSNGHKFECWFTNSRMFDEQRAFGVIHCPVCNDNRVEKAFSTFAIRKHTDRKEGKEEKKEEKMEPSRASYQALQALTEYVNKNFEDVGVDFPREALKMHLGEAEKRNIKGMALPDEEKVLQEEGVPFLKIPVLKRLDN
jgi:hypothetical protein